MKTMSTKEQMKDKEETTFLSLMRNHQIPELKKQMVLDITCHQTILLKVCL